MPGADFALSFWHWLALGLALMVLELLLPSTYFLWMGAAAMVVGILLWFMPAMSMDVQIILFALLSVTAIVLGKRYLRRNPIISDHPTLNLRGAQYIGRLVTLHEPIVNGVGRARLDDTQWKVFGPDLPADTRVRVIAVDGIALRVEALGGAQGAFDKAQDFEADGSGGD
jgi:Membrane protein implicated in regulation of membrane protease activity